MPDNVNTLAGIIASQLLAGAHFQRLSRPTVATRTSVNAAQINTLLLAANPVARMGASIYNGGGTALYVACGTTPATTADFTHKIAPGGMWEVPYGYSGEIRGIWDATASGAAKITEYTAPIT